MTINKSYAADHGKREFGKNYKILSKKVKASELFTDGNSIHEWGWNPNAQGDLKKHFSAMDVDEIEKELLK